MGAGGFLIRHDAERRGAELLRDVGVGDEAGGLEVFIGNRFAQAGEAAFEAGGFFPDETKDRVGPLAMHGGERARGDGAEVMMIEGTVHHDHGRGGGRRGIRGAKQVGVVAVINREESLARASGGGEKIGERIGDGEDAVGGVALRQREFVAFERGNKGPRREPRGPRLHETGEEIQEVHHDRDAELRAELARGDGGDRVLREEQIERRLRRGALHHAFQLGGEEEVFEITKLGVAAHLPRGEEVKFDTKFFRDGFRVGKSWGENVNVVAAADEFPREINRLGGPAAAGRIKGFVGQEGEAHGGGRGELARRLRQRLEELRQDARAAFEGRGGDPFVGGVGLGDVAGAEDDAGRAGLREHGGVAKKIHARGLALVGGVEEALHKRKRGIGLERQARAGARVGEGGFEFVLAEKFLDFGADARVGFAGNRAAVHGDEAVGGHDVGLHAAADDADVDRGRAEQGMTPGAKLRGVFGFEEVHDARHRVDGVAAEVRFGAVGGLAFSFDFEPEVAFVGGDDFEARGFADDGEVRAIRAAAEGARAGLVVLLVDQGGQNNFGVLRAALAFGEIGEGGEHRGDAALGVARATAVDAAVAQCGREHRVVGDADGVHVRGEEDAVFDGAGRGQAHEDVGAFGEDLFEENFEAGLGGFGGEKFGDAFFAGVVVACGKEGRVDAREGDEVAEEAFSSGHAGKV